MNKKDKILILATRDYQGSGLATYKISKFLLEAGYEVALLVRDKSRTDSFIIQISPPKKSIAQRVFNRLFPQFNSLKTDPKYNFYNIDEREKLVTSKSILDILPFTPDLIITGLISGFVNTTTLTELEAATKAGVYMLTVDMSALTGGCHYAWDCKGYQTDCRNCPAILDKSQKDRAYQNLKIKLKNVRRANIKVIAGSGWTVNQVKQSRLFGSQKTVYNNNGCIDTRIFNNRHRHYAKEIFNLPKDSKIIFTGSTLTDDIRKGMSYFVKALQFLWESIGKEGKKNTFILVAGNHTVKNDLIEQIPFQKQLIDFIGDYRLLSLAYQASDVFVCPSIEDSGPMMVSEALACGTPVVGFEMGATSNMVIDGYNGYKAELKNSMDLAKGMFEILSLSEEDYEAYSKNAIHHVEKYSSQKTVVTNFERILSEQA